MSTSRGFSLLGGRERPGPLIVSLAFATCGEGLLLGVVPAATPDVGRIFAVSPGALTWVNTAHLLAAGVATPVLARLGDMYGYRLLLRIVSGSALVGGLLCAAAPNFGVFVLGRVMEGAIASFAPLAIGVARARLDPRQLRRTVTVVIASLTGGSAVGLLVAALVFDATPSVRAVLWAPVACSAVTFALLFAFVPETPARVRARPDWPGFCTLSAGLVSLLLAISSGAGWGWTSPRTLGCLAAGAVLLAGWARIEWVTPQPAVNLRIVSRRDVAPFYLACLSFGCAYYGAQTATTYFLSSFGGLAGYGFDLNLTEIAFALLPGAALSMAGALAVAPLAARIPPRSLLSSGCLTVAAGYALTVIARGDLTGFVIVGCVTQLGLGIILGALTLVIAERSGRTEAGISTGLVSTIRNIGGSAATATFAALFTATSLPRTGLPSESAFVLVWLICGAAAVVTMLVVVAASEPAVAPETAAAPAAVTAAGSGVCIAGTEARP
jgi:MFS family permease